MKMTTSTPLRRGFTLIELLVVIAIIAVLAAIGVQVGAAVIGNARKLDAKNDCSTLVLGVDKYFRDYGHFPDTGGGNSDVSHLSDSTVMNILLGVGPAGILQNPHRNVYFQGKKARGKNGREYGGLFRTGSGDSGTADLFDTWKKNDPGQIRRYQIIWDGDYSDEIDDPFDGEILYDTRVIVWSTGKDGRETRSQANHADNRDNVYSWK